MNNFKRGIVLKSSHLNNPIPIILQHLLIVHPTHPKIHLGEILLHLDPHSIQIFIHILLGTDHSQQNIFPKTIALHPLEPQNKGSSIFVARVLPDRFDVLSEEIEVGADGQTRWSLEVLVVLPELFDWCDVGYWMQTVLEVLALHELLVPESQRVLQHQFLVVLHINQ